MKSIPLAILMLCFPLLILSQGEKGLKPVVNKSETVIYDTYAVIVGISDYQDEGIPDLQYADKDALAFAGYLQSVVGGALDEDHLKVLVNEQATQAQFGAALDWLWEVAKENDKVIIYFSGHGDVERKSITQPGYLLCWDAPPNVYMGGGAFNVRDLNDVVSTLSIQNKARVVLIIDACRAGKLSGSQIGGSQATAANLAKQYGNEIKILSCQPDEYSIEGEQWGGGRGAFSFHLLNGLNGMADVNDDLSVNLLEIGRYLEDHVSTEVAPHSQIPMTVGGRGEKLTTVFPEILVQLKAGKRDQLQLFAAIESRGIEDDVLTAADSTIVELYFAFKNSLEDKQFLFAETGRHENDYADFYYKKLIAESSMERLHSSMRRNYAAALQDDAQQVMNNWMKTSKEKALESKTGKKKGRLPIKVFTEKVRAFPSCLERAAELLGKEHYMYNTLQSRKHFFQGYLLANSDPNPNKELGDKALAQFRQALDLQPEMPQAYWQMIGVYGNNLLQPDSAEVYAQKAIELNPSWIEPYTRLAFLFMNDYNQYERALPYLEKATNLDSSSVAVLIRWAGYYNGQKEYAKAEKQFKKIIQLDSTYLAAYNNLGFFYLRTNRYDEAEEYLKKAIQLDSTVWMAFANLGRLYESQRRWEESALMTQKAIANGPPIGPIIARLGNVYTHLPGRLEEAKVKLDEGLAMNPEKPDVHIYLAEWYLKNDQLELAWKYFEEGLEKGVGNERLNLSDLKESPDFEEMQKDARWDVLLEKYFPEQNKN